VTGDTIQIGNLVTDAKTLQLANTAANANAATGSGITVGASDNIATLLYSSTGNVWTTNIGVSAVGNITAPYFIGNGSQLTGLPVPYGNANVVTLLAGFGSNTVSTSGNVTAGNVLTSAQVIASGVIQTGTGFSTGGYLSVNGSTDLHDTNIIGTLSVNTIRSDDSTIVQIQDGLDVDGNVTADYFIGDGSQLTGISSTGNLAVIGTTIVIDADAPETSIYISPSGEGYAYFELPNNATANTVNTGLWNAAGNVEIGTGDVSNAGPTYTWLFDNTGNLVLPQGGVVYETSIPGGVFAANTIALKPFGGIDADQQLLIYPTGNIFTDINHLHLTSGNLYNTELFLGNDDLYVKLANTGNIVVNANDNIGNSAQWTFTTNGTTVFPGDLAGSGASPAPSINGFGSINSITLSASGNVTGAFIKGNGSELTNLPAPSVAQDITSVGDMSIMTYDGNLKYVNNATVEPATGSIKTAGNISATGNITGSYIFGNGSQLTGLPATYGNANVATFLAAYGSNTVVTTGNITGGNLISSATMYGNIDIILGNTANASATRTRLVSNTEFSYIQTGNGTAGSTGNIVFSPYLSSVQRVVVDTASGNVSAVGNVTAQNFIGNGAGLTNVTVSLAGNIVGTQPNVTLVAGSYSTVFDNTGVATFPGNISTAGNFVGNGAALTGVAVRTTGTWTAATGTNTYSITVPINGTYQIWVRGNIPNGILVYQATVSVTNTNVPVLGTQRAWNYVAAGSPISLTTMPTQIIGVEDTISTATVSTTTANVFNFVISNTSGSPQTIFWGYVTL
jgi:hypothetical protein